MHRSSSFVRSPSMLRRRSLFPHPSARPAGEIIRSVSSPALRGSSVPASAQQHVEPEVMAVGPVRQSSRCSCCVGVTVCQGAVALLAFTIVGFNGYSDFIGSSAGMESLEDKKLLWCISMNATIGLSLSILAGIQGVILDIFYTCRYLSIIIHSLRHRQLPLTWQQYKQAAVERRQFCQAMSKTFVLSTLSAALSAIITYYFCKEEEYDPYWTAFLAFMAVIGSLALEVIPLGEALLKTASGNASEEKYSNSLSAFLVKMGRVFCWLAIPSELLFCYLYLKDEVFVDNLLWEIVIRSVLSAIAVATYFGAMRAITDDAMNGLGIAIKEDQAYKNPKHWILFPAAIFCAAATTQASLTFLVEQLQHPENGLPVESEPQLWVAPVIIASAVLNTVVLAVYALSLLFNTIFFCGNKKKVEPEEKDLEQPVVAAADPAQPLLQVPRRSIFGSRPAASSINAKQDEAIKATCCC